MKNPGISFFLLALFVLAFSQTRANAQGVHGCQCMFSDGSHSECYNTFGGLPCNCVVPPGLRLQRPPDLPNMCPVDTHSGTYTSLVNHILWSLWHQGAKVWLDPNQDTLISGKALADVLLATQDDKNRFRRTYPGEEHSEQGYREMSDAIERGAFKSIESATVEALQRCKAETPAKDARTNLVWVWGHENLGRALYEAGKRRNYDQVRQIYHGAQDRTSDRNHADDLKNNLSCYSGPEIQAMLDSFGAPPALPTQPYSRKDH